MRIFFVLLMFTFLSVSATAQTKNQTPAPSSQYDSRKVVELPHLSGGFRPKVTLQQAMKVMASYIKKEKIDTSSYYLREVKMIQYGSDKDGREPRWFFWWLNEKGELGNYIQITVSMAGKVARHPSM